MSADRDAADRFARSLVDDHGRAADEAARLLVTGGPHEVAERFAEYSQAGVERLVAAPTGGDWMRHCELIAEAQALLESRISGAAAAVGSISRDPTDKE